jgi:hypothetical protein
MTPDPPFNPDRPYLDPHIWRITYLPDDDTVLDLDQ